MIKIFKEINICYSELNNSLGSGVPLHHPSLPQEFGLKGEVWFTSVLTDEVGSLSCFYFIFFKPLQVAASFLWHIKKLISLEVCILFLELIKSAAASCGEGLMMTDSNWLSLDRVLMGFSGVSWAPCARALPVPSRAFTDTAAWGRARDTQGA